MVLGLDVKNLIVLQLRAARVAACKNGNSIPIVFSITVLA